MGKDRASNNLFLFNHLDHDERIEFVRCLGQADRMALLESLHLDSPIPELSTALDLAAHRGIKQAIDKYFAVKKLRKKVRSLQKKLKRPISARNRTRPMTIKEAARLMGYARKRDEKKAAETLKKAMDAGVVPYEMINRQQYIFDRTHFSREVWEKLAPTGTS